MCFGSKTTAKNASITMSLPQVWHIYLARSLLSKHLKKILDSVFLFTLFETAEIR